MCAKPRFHPPFFSLFKTDSKRISRYIAKNYTINSIKKEKITGYYTMHKTGREAHASAKWHFSAIKYIVSV